MTLQELTTMRRSLPQSRLLPTLLSMTILAGLTPARADVTGHPMLTLDQCVEIALEKSPSLAAAGHRAEAGAEVVGQARALYYPTLDATAGYNRWERHAFLPSGLTSNSDTDIIGPTDDWMAVLQARFMLFDGGERREGVAAAVARRDAAEQDADGVRRNVIIGVHHGYYDLLAAGETQSIASKNLERSQDHLRLAEHRRTAGTVSKSDVLRALLEVADAELALDSADSMVRIAGGRLNTAMGRPVETEIGVAGGAPDLVAPDEGSLRTYLEQAESARPDLRAALRRIEAAGHEVRAVRSKYKPRLATEASYGWRDSVFLPEDQDWLVGVSIRLPLFDGSFRKHQVARARAELEQERAEAERFRMQVRQEVWIAHSKLLEAYSAVETTRVQVADAEETLRDMEMRYEVGASTMTDLLDTQTAMARAEARLVEARWNYHLAHSELRWASGEPLS